MSWTFTRPGRPFGKEITKRLDAMPPKEYDNYRSEVEKLLDDAIRHGIEQVSNISHKLITWLFASNSGAAIGVLTFIGNVNPENKQGVIIVLSVFMVGVVSIIIHAVVEYLTLLSSLSGSSKDYKQIRSGTVEQQRKVIVDLYNPDDYLVHPLRMIPSVISLLCLVIGFVYGGIVLTNL